MQKRKPITVILTVAVFLVLEGAALAILRYSNDLQRSWFGAAGHSVMSALWGGSQQIHDYFVLRSRNDSIAVENFALTRRIASLEDSLNAFRAQRATEKVEIGHGNCDRYGFIPGTIIKVSTNRQHNYLLIDRGSADGVMEGAGVITPMGVVGIVEAVSRNYSYCISFQNYNMSVSARLGADGPVGPLVWDGNRRATLSEIPHHTVKELGDTVYTSGYSAIFPRDIPLGVTVDSHLKDGATYRMDVELFEDFSTLRYVTLVNNLDSDEISSLEKEGRK